MGLQALKAAVICCLALSKALGEEKKVNSSVADNESADSAPRLYHSVPFSVYASAAPHGAFSFHAPSVANGPVVASTQVKSVVVPNTRGFIKDLKDSYGKFVSPADTRYKMAFPTQYVQLQELPAHLSQPLAIAAAPSLQYKQAVPHYVFGSQPYRIPAASHSSASPTPLTHFGRFSQPLVYAENTRGFAPSTSGFFASVPGFPTSQQQANVSPYHPTTFHSNNPTSFHFNAPASFQRLQASPEGAQTQQWNSGPKTYEESKKVSHYEESQSSRTPQSFSKYSNNNDNKDSKQKEDANDNGQIQAAPAQTSITAIVNGKKTVVTLETQPPLPLLDLNLLEPLTFDNPVVPQVQQFLPRINEATYHKLPSLNVNNGKKNLNKEFVKHKTKSYDSEVIVGKPKEKKIPNKKPNKPAKPTIIVSGDPNGGPEISYEINSPNHKETYNEQVISYNKKTNTQPVSYSYNNKEQKKPVTYSFSHSSKEPLKTQHVEYESNPENPKELIYTFTPEDQGEQNEEVQQPPGQSENSEEASDESEDEDDDQPSHLQRVEHRGHHSESPNRHSSQGQYNEAPHPHHQESPRNSQRHENSHHHESPNHHSRSPNHHSKSPNHHDSPNHYHEGPSNHNRPQNHHEGPPRQIQHYQEVPPTQQAYYQSSHPPQKQPHPSGGHRDSPRQSHQLRPEHRHPPTNQVQQEFVQLTPQFFSTPLTYTVQNAFQAITPEYNKNIHLLKPHKPNAPIKVDPSQHVQLGPTTPYASAPPSPAPQKVSQEQLQRDDRPTSGPHSSAAPHVVEKFKGVVIKQEVPEDHQDDDESEEQLEEINNDDQSNEEEFEKAYKNSAIGFPAYEEKDEDKEDIYDPESYGQPKYHTQFDIKNSPFEQYQQEGDDFPKSARLTYKDARDKMKEDYFLDYAISKPQSFKDHHRQKDDYYKTYKHNSPEKLFGFDEEKKPKKKEKYVLEPPSFTFSSPIFGHEDEKKPKRKEKYVHGPPSFAYSSPIFGHEEEKPKQKEKYVIASPSFSYPSSVFKPKENKQFFIKYKAAPKLYEFDYSKGAPREDSSAFASSSQPFRKYKTHFVEPQFHYGFSPVAPSLVLDSELAAMASNHSPESEKPLRKKVYKENWYIKKTTTAVKPS